MKIIFQTCFPLLFFFSFFLFFFFFPRLGFVTPDMNRITGWNLAHRSRAIGYTAHCRHWPHVNCDMEQIIHEEHPHCVQRSFITHTHIHARTHTHSLSHNMVCDGRRYSTESASERCHTHHTAAPWRFTLQRLQGGFLNIRMNEKIEYLTSESNSDVFRQNYNLIFFVRLCSSAFRLFWYWVLFDIC